MQRYMADLPLEVRFLDIYGHGWSSDVRVLQRFSEQRRQAWQRHP